jgi:class 3 adenylate cyclase/tetratricopeptide (TPR) repeat protein
MHCSACGTENEGGRKFCGECGAALVAVCTSCGSPNTPGVKFCGECGEALGGPPEVAEAPGEGPATERRLVSVLFGDLVGFTSASELRDAEDTRELLSRYFDACRRLIELYGGTVEKFIGDAVMAVWGTPTATEDDAERAVRAALDLVAAVAALGDEVGTPDLRARAGVLTGEAAVTIGAEGQGMVAGDLVNTASRIQALAEPGTVLVGEATRRSTDQTIVYADAGSHELKGKSGLVPLWQALRVVSGARGSLKSTGLEAPFVGRDAELRRIKDLFHTSADEGKPQLISVTGIAGIGKSRLAWEFYKYFDGLPQLTYWHRGRCLSYGEGVTYWALADMVRMRARIAEDEEQSSAIAKLAAVVEEHLTDGEERRFAEPRLRHLLGLEENTRFEREDLFAAWRLFFERLADVYPTVLVFEDMQWADASLLDFIEYLLEWSRNSPLFVMTLARPELQDRRPTWGAATRNFTSVYLDPLPEASMEELLGGLVPGLPDELRRQILDRAEGIPLYAVETVRMLLDRGALIQAESAYRPTGTIESLEVPETLHALIAARLDGLAAGERRVLQDGAVLGKTFTKQALAAVSALAEADLEPILLSLTRKELFGVQSDPRSPEHGQYGFLQDLLRRIAYETLPRRERKARHLAAAAHLEQASSEQEVVEVLASHYVDAYAADPGADDAAAIKAKAQAALARAGERAASLGAPEEAQRYFEQAADLADDRLEQAHLLGRAGEMAGLAAKPEVTRNLLEQSIAIYEEAGESHAAARIASRYAQILSFTGYRDEALERIERAFEVISTDEPDEVLALLSGQLSRSYWFSGDIERAAERAELALDIGEALGLPRALSLGLRAKAAVLSSRQHREEAHALLKHALDIALEHDLFEDVSTFYFLLSDQCFRTDRYDEALAYLDESLTFDQRMGHRRFELATIAESCYPLMMLGRWDEVLAIRDGFTEDQVNAGGVVLSLLQGGVEIYCRRGRLDDARELLSLFARLEDSTDVQDRGSYLACLAVLRRAEGRLDEAIQAGTETLTTVVETLGPDFQGVKHAVIEALEAALALGDVRRADELFGFVEGISPGVRPPYFDAHVARLRARQSGDVRGLADAAVRFRALGIPFWLGVTLLEQAEALGASDEATSLRAEARQIFERLEATPWLGRCDRLAPAQAASASV